MIRTKQILRTSVVEIESDGQWNTREMAAVTGALRTFIKQHGKICLLERVIAIGTHTPLLWDQIAGMFDDVSEISHVAVVADEEGIDVFSPAFCDERYFPVRLYSPAQYDEGVAWLRDCSVPGKSLGESFQTSPEALNSDGQVKVICS